MYEAKAVLLVQQRGSSYSPGAGDFAVSEQLAATYGRLVTSETFLTKVAEESELDLSVGRLKGMVSARSQSNPPILEIGTKDSDPVLAARTTNVVANEFIDYAIERGLAAIAQRQAAAAAQGLSANVQDLIAVAGVVDILEILEPADVPSQPVIPRTRQNVVLGVLLGLMLAGGGALLLFSMSDTVRDPDEISRRFGATALGTIFRWSPQDIEENDLIVTKSPSSNFSESFRQVRANFQFATAGRPGKSYLVTSPGPGEGKSTIIGNLAVSFAQTGKRVIVVDGDLRRPSVHRLLPPTKREPGLSNYLADDQTNLSSVLHPAAAEGVSVIPGGLVPPNPSELLGSPRMGALLERLSQLADIVLIDSPPALLVADALVLAAQVDGAMLVVDGLHTRSASLKAALTTLVNTQVAVVGVIINKMRRTRFGYGYHYYPYYYYHAGYKYYYRASDSDGVHTDGARPAYLRPIGWFKSIFSRSQPPKT